MPPSSSTDFTSSSIHGSVGKKCCQPFAAPRQTCATHSGAQRPKYRFPSASVYGPLVTKSSLLLPGCLFCKALMCCLNEVFFLSSGYPDSGLPPGFLPSFSYSQRQSALIHRYRPSQSGNRPPFRPVRFLLFDLTTTPSIACKLASWLLDDSIHSGKSRSSTAVRFRESLPRDVLLDESRLQQLQCICVVQLIV
jgi:hypothetical protein